MAVGAAPTNRGIESSTAYQREQADKASAANGGVSKMDFMKLLTEQLTHQDPLNPSQDIDFTAQLAQLQALDEQMSMTKTMQALRTDTQMQAGTGMIGKYVSGTDNVGTAATGLVERIVSTSDGVFCELANKQRVPVENINNVWNDANSMTNDLANSGNVIGMWVEAGYDSAYQPIRGIVESVGMSKDGTVVLNLYGGQSVTWDQVDGMRIPTEDEQLLYQLKDDVRKKFEKGLDMTGMAVTGKDAKGNTVTGIVASPGLSEDYKKVYLTLMTGEVIEYDSVKTDPRMPNADEVKKAFGVNETWVVGLDKDGNMAGGIVADAVDSGDGDVVELILDDGQRVFYDTLQSPPETAEDETKARLIGMFAKGVNADGEEVEGVITAKVTVDGRLGVKLSTGEVILCKDLAEVREAADEEAPPEEEEIEG